MRMELVKCTPQYWEFVRVLRNDERVQSGFIKSNPISPKDQEYYMHNNAHHYRIALVDKEPAGYVGVIEDDIRVCTHPDYQGKGVGKFMINEIMKEYPTAFAKVKIDNEASLRLFRSCGFKKKFYILTKD